MNGIVGDIKDYQVVKEIKMVEGTVPAGTIIQELYVQGQTAIHFNGGLLPPGYQESFQRLINEEKKFGWKYLKPIPPVRNRL